MADSHSLYYPIYYNSKYTRERGKKNKKEGLTALANEPPIDESLIAWHRNADIAYKLPRYRA